MYEAYYHLTGKPFRLSPDARFYFASRSHERAMAYLQYGVAEGEGFVVITGDIGTGKTTLVETLIQGLDTERLVLVRLSNTGLDDNEILRMVAAELGVAFEGISKAGLLRGIERLLGRLAGQGKRVLLLIDEAQNLSVAALEELRMLSNFQSISSPYFQTFLLGQKEFVSTLRSPELAQLSQRVIASYHLSALSADEIRPYIIHRLNRVGWQGDPSFDDAVFESIHEITGGIPRRINTLADRLLLFGFLEELHAIDRSVVDRVVEELDAEVAMPLRSPPRAAFVGGGGSEERGIASSMAGFDERLTAIEERLDALEDAMTLEHARLRALDLRRRSGAD